MERRICWILAAVLLLGVTCSAQPSPKCSVSPEDRINCGYPGISRGSCRAQGCCFDSSIPGALGCFVPAPLEDSPECSVSPKDRKKCGYPHISADSCRAQGCCFDSSNAGALGCFVPAPL